jgi:hypothetical protein
LAGDSVPAGQLICSAQEGEGAVQLLAYLSGRAWTVEHHRATPSKCC